MKRFGTGQTGFDSWLCPSKDAQSLNLEELTSFIYQVGILVPILQDCDEDQKREGTKGWPKIKFGAFYSMTSFLTFVLL